MTTNIWTPEALPDDAVELGRLGEAWGIKGWVKVHPYSADPQVLFAAEHWWLQAPAAPHDRHFKAFAGTVRVAVDEIKPHAETLVARISGVNDRSAAEDLRGARIYVPRSQFPESSDPDEFYWVDLMGLRVVNREGVELGFVTDLLATGPTSVLVVADTQGDKAVERLIPFVSAYVDRVDRAARCIHVDWQPDY